MKIICSIFLILASSTSLFTQINYETNSIDSILMNDTIQFWGSQMESKYDENGKHLGSNYIYSGISIFTKDSIHYFNLISGYTSSVDYVLNADSMMINDRKEELKMPNETTINFIDRANRTIDTYILMSLPREYFIKMYESRKSVERMELNNEQEKAFDKLISNWIKELDRFPKWPE